MCRRPPPEQDSSPTIELVTIESGDERCLFGGTVLRVVAGDDAQQALACNVP